MRRPLLAAVVVAVLAAPAPALATHVPLRVAGVPAALQAGAQRDLRVTVVNRGERSVRSVRLAFKLSKRRRTTPLGRTAGPVRVWRGTLRPGRTLRLRVTLRVPPALPAGRWWVVACAARRCTSATRAIVVVPRPPHAGPVRPVAPPPTPRPAPSAALPCLDGDPSRPTFPVTPGPEGVRGRVLPGRELRSEIVIGEQPPAFPSLKADAPHYPGGRYPEGEPQWALVPAGIPTTYAHDAEARFNDEDAAHRVAHHISHFGGQPDRAGDINGDGIEDLMITEHFAWVDGMSQAGEVHLYYGRRGGIDPRVHKPDVVFYGDQTNGELGLSLAPGGDVDGDGWDDLLMAAGFHTTTTADGREVPFAGEVYVVFGGFLHRFGCTVKVRTSDIGRAVPGWALEGGHDGRLRTGWANDLESGDFDGDGFSDVIIGAADPKPGDQPTFAARGYLVFGGPDVPTHLRGVRLGVDTAPLRSITFEAPDGEDTRHSLGFGAQFAGDLDGDGRDELAFTTGRAGPERRGRAYLFRGTAAAPAAQPVPFAAADLTIEPDEDPANGLRFARLEGVRPAGDVDGDGRQDALVHARGTRRTSDGKVVGATGILFGRAALPAAMGFSELQTKLVGRPEGRAGQPAMDRPADLDGDGFSEVLVNDPYFRELVGGDLQQRGRLWILRGGPGRPAVIDVHAEAAATLLADVRVPGMFGYAWNTGDWDGDGRPDVIVGDHYAGDRELHEHAGRVYLFRNGGSLRLAP